MGWIERGRWVARLMPFIARAMYLPELIDFVTAIPIPSASRLNFGGLRAQGCLLTKCSALLSCPGLRICRKLAHSGHGSQVQRAPAGGASALSGSGQLPLGWCIWWHASEAQLRRKVYWVAAQCSMIRCRRFRTGSLPYRGEHSGHTHDTLHFHAHLYYRSVFVAWVHALAFALVVMLSIIWTVPTRTTDITAPPLSTVRESLFEQCSGGTYTIRSLATAYIVMTYMT
jgi:hypothetical protein